ncbi:MAG: aminotransferase class IV [Lewinellaceae bacterium]|nr:aminotransferase class IV [Saprospiraceae bacterium]MCB9340269.1 aminotransferase class IV [Lewinellaceae bacterium]
MNGRILPGNQASLTVGNRAFRYGDGLFESIRVFEGKMPFFDQHWQRLLEGMKLLKFEVPDSYSPAFFQQEIAQLTKQCGNWRVRLTIFRTEGGLYTPVSDMPEFLIEASALESSQFQLNENGLTIGTYDEMLLLSSNHPAIQSFKTCNALPLVLAGIYKKKQGWDECLLLNQLGRVACCGNANVFLVKNNVLHTPSLGEGCVAGTMRKLILELAMELEMQVVQSPVHLKEIGSADEIFLTNAIQGIRWVKTLQGFKKIFNNKLTASLVLALNDKIR